MRDNDALLFVLLAGLGIWFLTRNPNPGQFYATAPFPGQGLITDIIPMNVSSAGREFIKDQEGYSAHPFTDSDGKQRWGYSTPYNSSMGQSISKLDASQQLDNYLVPVEDAINNNVTVPINQNQFDALADFIYNVGIGAFQKSTLLKMLNNGNYSGASNQFMQWANKNRRMADANLFDSISPG
jgi:lysozyme